MQLSASQAQVSELKAQLVGSESRVQLLEAAAAAARQRTSTAVRREPEAAAIGGSGDVARAESSLLRAEVAKLTFEVSSAHFSWLLEYL